MEYNDKYKNTVKLFKDNKFYIVPRGHRLWLDFEIDKAEAQGKIKEYAGE